MSSTCKEGPILDCCMEIKRDLSLRERITEAVKIGFGKLPNPEIFCNKSGWQNKRIERDTVNAIADSVAGVILEEVKNFISKSIHKERTGHD